MQVWLTQQAEGTVLTSSGKMMQYTGMERSEISRHEVQIYQVLKNNPTQWFTNKTLSDASKVTGRTVRLHTNRFVKLGIVDLAEVFPAHRYRFAEKASRRNAAYVQRLENAVEVFTEAVRC